MAVKAGIASRPVAGSSWNGALATCGMLVAAASLALGASVSHVALLFSWLSVSLMLLVLRGERRRNAMLCSMLDRLGREAGVAVSRQDL